MQTNQSNNIKTEQISIHLDSDVKQRIEKAAAMDHRSITSFILASAIASANEILERENQIVLNEQEWERFYNVMLNPPKPNEALKKAFVDYKKMNIRSDV